MKEKIKIIVYVILLIVGTVILIQSPIIGKNIAHSYVFKYDSSADTSYLRLMQSNFIISYRILGSIITGISALGLLKEFSK